MSIMDVPVEVLEYMFAFMPVADVCALGQTCIDLCRVVDQLPMWKMRVLRDVPSYTATKKTHWTCIQSCMRDMLTQRYACNPNTMNVDMEQYATCDMQNITFDVEHVKLLPFNERCDAFSSFLVQIEEEVDGAMAVCRDISHVNLDKMAGLPWNRRDWPNPCRRAVVGPRVSYKLIVDAHESFRATIRATAVGRMTKLEREIARLQWHVRRMRNYKSARNMRILNLCDAHKKEYHKLRRKLLRTRSVLGVFEHVLPHDRVAILKNAVRAGEGIQ
jgi:hypothetical protein